MVQQIKDLLGLFAQLKAMRAAFDPDYYRACAPELAGLSAAELRTHYALIGWRQGLDPTPDFSTLRYLEANEDVAQSGANPFVHFLTKGQREGRDPRPDFWLDAELAQIRPYFEPGYYRQDAPALSHLDDLRLLEHFHHTGWREGRDPGPAFSVTGYLEANADVARSGVNPVLHYVQRGQAEGRALPRPAPQAWAHLTEAQIEALEAWFDPVFYAQAVQDPAAPPRALLAHYIDVGWREGLDPSAAFSGSFYRQTYGGRGDICPLIDFVLGTYTHARRTRPEAPQRFGRDPQALTVPHRLMAVLKRKADADGVRPPARIVAQEGLDLHWVIPDFPRGSGGHMTIFRLIRLLEGAGHRCTIWVEQPIFHETAAQVHDDIVKHFQCVEAEVRFAEEGLFNTSGDAVIATSWSSAYYVQATQGFAGKFYLVQDHEPDFYPAGAERLLARRTYGFDLACLCAGPWLAGMMQARYGRWSRSFDLAYDKDIYQLSPLRQAGAGAPMRIAVYARDHTPRRCVHLALMGLELLAGQHADVEVHLFGQEEMAFRAAPFEVVNHGVLDEAGLAALYNSCDLGLCFSATNYALVPQEMMACGLPVIELDGPSTRAVFPAQAVTLAAPEPEAICAAIARLLEDPAGRQAQAEAGRAWVQRFDWNTAAGAVEAALLERLAETGHVPQDLCAPVVRPSSELLLDVVIPTYNGRAELEPVITALRGQTLAGQMQIHCIDSRSSDGTTEWLRAQPDIALTVIDQAQFQHGRTRNEGAGLGTAPLIGFLTQDATPTGPNWAVDIVKMMRHYPQAAGLFGRHRPYPAHSLRVRQDITAHFENMMRHPLALSKETDPVRWRSGDAEWRRLLHFYSDNNSAMRRSVWQAHPYPEVDFGEDQLWARAIIEAGYTKLYAPTAAVYHSHDFTPEEAYARSHIEGAFFWTYFGYELGEGSLEQLEQRLHQAQGDLVTWARQYQVEAAELHRQQQVLARKYHGWRDGRLAAQEETGA